MDTSAALFDRPIVIIGCNRSGTTLLFNILSAHPVTWSLYIESQSQFHRHFPVHPVQGERVGESASDAVRAKILEDLFRSAHNKQFFQRFPVLRWLPDKLFQRPVRHLYRRAPLRLVEKTPANSLRIPLVASLFPDARFIHIVRRGEDVVSSLMEGWKHWSRVTHGAWTYTGWHYLVPPGWQNQVQKTLQEICTFQWSRSNQFARDDLQRVEPRRRMLVRHEDLIADPVAMYRQILGFCELDPSAEFDLSMRRIGSQLFTTGGSAPRREKWRTIHGAEIESVRHLIEPMNQSLYG